MSAQKLLRELREQANPDKARQLRRFFKTGPGEYGAGDVFLGVTVPVVRSIARNYLDLPLTELRKLSRSRFHEVRFSALVILTLQYRRAETRARERELYTFYMNQLKSGSVNNWDLVDVSAPIIGEYLLSEREARTLLRKMARSSDLWIRRTSILFTFASLRLGDTKPTLDICTMLLADEHDLIQKAVGWALREVGKIDPAQLRTFLKDKGQKMSRTSLRYSIERFPPRERKAWLERTR